MLWLKVGLGLMVTGLGAAIATHIRHHLWDRDKGKIVSYTMDRKPIWSSKKAEPSLVLYGVGFILFVVGFLLIVALVIFCPCVSDSMKNTIN